MSLFVDLVDSGKVRTKDELRSFYRRVVKTYHPDSHPEAKRALDFDELKRDYRAAVQRLDELERLAPSGAAPAPLGDEAFLAELRDLVARGLPANAKAVRRNKAYAASIERISAGIAGRYGEAYSFEELNSQLKFLYRRMPRIHYYALQVLWSSFDCASGYDYAERIAARHLGCIDSYLAQMGFASLERFLSDVIALSARLCARVSASTRP